MADKTTGGPSKGMPHGGDQTAMPGQAEGDLPFGLHNMLSTGAPGTGGAAPDATDPTRTVAVPNTVFGSPNEMKTGAPGHSGAHDDVPTGATYTKDSLDAYPREDAVGGSVGTEAQANHYGTPNGMPGDYQPTSTGAGHGRTMIGGRRVHQA